MEGQHTQEPSAQVEAVDTPWGCIPLLDFVPKSQTPWTHGQDKLIRNLRFFHVLCNLLSPWLPLTPCIHSQTAKPELHSGQPVQDDKGTSTGDQVGMGDTGP